jgi:hypothetical protein
MNLIIWRQWKYTEIWRRVDWQEPQNPQSDDILKIKNELFGN